MNSKHSDDSPSHTRESLIDFKKLFRKDTRSKTLCKEEAKFKDDSPIQVIESVESINDFTVLESKDESSEDQPCEVAEEAKETTEDDEEPQVKPLETVREASTRNPEPVRAQSVESARRHPKFRLRDHLTRLDARVRRAFSWEHSQNGPTTSPLFFDIDEPEVKLCIPAEDQISPGEDNTSTTSETQKAQDPQPVPFLRCSPSTSISSSPGASPKATPGPSPMEERVFVEKSSEEESGSSSAVLSSKASLELFDEEGNPIPPIRRKAGVGSDQEVKLSAESERRKLSQASSWSGYSDPATHDLSPPRTTVTSVTPTTEESGGHPAPALTSPSNMGAFKTFISHIGKKGSSQGLVGTFSSKLLKMRLSKN